MQNKVKTNLEKCKNCGSNLTFNPDNQTLSCMSCETHLPIKSNSGLYMHMYDKNNNLNRHNNSNLIKQSRLMQCQNCGASIVLLDYQTSAFCPYCNTGMIASHEQFDGLKPDSIIPFKFGKEKAVQILKSKLKNNWFVPSKFKSSINADEIKAYYFPAFIFDAECSTFYEGRLYNDSTKRKSDGSTETSRTYFTIKGKKQTSHANIEIEASSNLGQHELEMIRPYNFNDAQKYSNEFVYGFALEHYNNSLENSNNLAKKIMIKKIQEKILSSYHYDGIDSLKLQPTFYDEKFSYCILPIYRINYLYKNKKYSNIINGQTGKLAGKHPKSATKIALAVLLSVLSFALPLLLFTLLAII